MGIGLGAVVGKSGRAGLGGRNAPAGGRQARPDLSAAKSGKKQKAVQGSLFGFAASGTKTHATLTHAAGRYPGPIRQLSGGQLPGPLPGGASRRAMAVGLGAVVGKSGRAGLGGRNAPAQGVMRARKTGWWTVFGEERPRRARGSQGPSRLMVRRKPEERQARPSGQCPDLSAAKSGKKQKPARGPHGGCTASGANSTAAPPA